MRRADLNFENEKRNPLQKIRQKLGKISSKHPIIQSHTQNTCTQNECKMIKCTQRCGTSQIKNHDEDVSRKP